MSATNDLNGINLQAIYALSETPSDEFGVLMDMGTQGNEMHNALRDALAEDRKKQIANTAKDLLALIRAGETSLQQSVTAIRTARAKEREHMTRVKALERAIQYGKETMDMRPLVSLLSNDHVHVVPATWKNKNTKERTAAVRTEPGKK